MGERWSSRGWGGVEGRGWVTERVAQAQQAQLAPQTQQTQHRPSKQPTEDSCSGSEHEEWEGESWHTREKHG